MPMKRRRSARGQRNVIMPWSVSFQVWGDQFKPSLIDFAFTESHDPGDIAKLGRYRGQPMPYGSASIHVPIHIPNGERIKYIVDIALRLLPELQRAGATEWHVDIGRFYSTQCNEEYSAEEISLLAQLRCPLLYSAYLVSEEDESKLGRNLESFSTE